MNHPLHVTISSSHTPCTYRHLVAASTAKQTYSHTLPIQDPEYPQCKFLSRFCQNRINVTACSVFLARTLCLKPLLKKKGFYGVEVKTIFASPQHCEVFYTPQICEYLCVFQWNARKVSSPRIKAERRILTSPFRWGRWGRGREPCLKS